jgi:PAS domain S-box-containing protein
MDNLPAIGNGVVAIAQAKGRPEFWQSWWFLIAVTLASAGVVAAYFLQRMTLLADEEERLREVIDAIPAMACITRSDGDCTFVNRRWLDYTGLTVEQTSGSGWQAAVRPDDLDRVANKWLASTDAGEPFEQEIRIRRVIDGVYRWFLVRAVPIRDKRGKILKWCGAATDIEDRKQAEQLQAALAHASRVNTMEKLVASISHELAQPVMATTLHAKASLQWLRHQPPNLAKVQEGSEKIVEAGAFAAGILDRLRSMYRKAPPNRELVAVNQVIEEMAAMLTNDAMWHRVSIRTDLKADLPKTKADRVQLQQVLMNLMLNAIEAMSETGGVLTVKSQSGAPRRIQVSVSDTGPGLPPDKTNQLFDSFFTSKPQGSGMGLPISKSIVEAHGGRIWAMSGEEGGAVFHFTLPIPEGEANETAT